MEYKKKKCIKCEKDVYLWSHKMCKVCYFKSTPLKSVKKPKKQKINRYSEKAKQRNLDYKAVRAEFLEGKDHCEVALPDCLFPYPVFEKTDFQVHHMAGRCGKLLTEKKYFLCVCGNCHRYLEDHPAWAMENGYSISRHSKDL